MIPGAVLDVIDDCGHMVTMEQPERVADALLHWLRAPAAGPRKGAPMGELSVRVQAVRDEALDVRSFALVAADARPLPAFAAGSHIDVHVAPGLVRQYSLCGDSADTARYQIAVKREPASRGGSQAMHERVREGDLLTISAPRNNFALVPVGEASSADRRRDRHHAAPRHGAAARTRGRRILPRLFLPVDRAHGVPRAPVDAGISRPRHVPLRARARAGARLPAQDAVDPAAGRASLSVRAAPVHGPGRDDRRADVAAGRRAPRVLLRGSGLARGARRKASSSSSRATAASSRSPRAGRSSKCSRSTA